MTTAGTAEMVDTITDEMVEPDKPLQCEHSHHNAPGWHHHHGGPATHYVRALHNCDSRPAVYPVCAPFAAAVIALMDKGWMCPTCRHIDDGRFMVEVVAIISA